MPEIWYEPRAIFKPYVCDCKFEENIGVHTPDWSCIVNYMHSISIDAHLRQHSNKCTLPFACTRLTNHKSCKI